MRVPVEIDCTTTEARERSILGYMPMVEYLAQRFGLSFSYVETEDLIHDGVLGLMDAIARYDSTHHALFRTYAAFRIQGAMQDALRSLDWVPRSVREKERALARAYERFEQIYGRPGDDDEVAALLGVSLETLCAWRSTVRGVSLLSLEGEWFRDADTEPLSMLDVVSIASKDEPASVCETYSGQTALAHALERLPSQEKTVIVLYYYEELTIKEIGKVLEVTESRISQIHKSALGHLRKRVMGMHLCVG